MAAQEIFANQPSTTISSGGTTAPAAGTQESWTAASSASFPAASSSTASQPTQFHVVDTALQSEIIAVINVSGTTWTVLRGAEGTTPVAHTAGFTVRQVVTSGWLANLQGTANGFAYQFYPEFFGAKGDGAFLYDVAITSGQATLTTVGLPAPSAPTVNNSGAGGTVAAGTYQVKVTYVNAFGETLASSASATTTSGTTSKITVTSPGSWTNATGYYVYCSQAGGAAGSVTRQQAPGSPTSLGDQYVITAPPTNTGASAPVANTTASAPFKASDAGKLIVVPDAGGSDVPLCTTIQTFNNSGSVTLAANASATITSYGAVYGTDDTTAVQNCINAAVAYGQTSEQGLAEIIAGNKMYCIGGAVQTTGVGGGANNYWDAQLTIPYVHSFVGPKVQLKITGPVEASGPVHWNQPNPEANGAVLVCMRGDGAYTGDQQCTSVLGGPTNGFGGSNGAYSNMRVVVDGLNMLVPYGPTYAGLDLYGVGQASIRSFSYFCMARTTVGSAGGWPLYLSGGYTGSWRTFGYRPPSPGNNAQNDVDRMTIYGSWTGFFFGDHFVGGSIKVIFCQGAAFPFNAAFGTSHGSYIASLCSEATTYPLYAPNSGQFAIGGGNGTPLVVGVLALESQSAVALDSNNCLYGQVLSVEQLSTLQLTSTGAANLRVFQGNQAPGKIGSPPAVPSSTVAYTNNFGRDATVVISGGTVTVIAIDTVTTGQTSGAVFVRNGGTITLTYSVAPSWNWILA